MLEQTYLWKMADATKNSCFERSKRQRQTDREGRATGREEQMKRKRVNEREGD